LTESFCIAILEAACCGLLVVSTDVGGVPEVLPPHMAYLAKPEPTSIINQLTKAVEDIKTTNTENFNNELSQIYNWRTIAERTEKVYDYAVERPNANVSDRLKNAFAQGNISGLYCVFYVILEFIVLAFSEYLLPDWEIDTVNHFNQTSYNKNIKLHGDHELYVDNNDPRNIQKMSEIEVNQEFLKTHIQPAKFDKKRRFKTVIPVGFKNQSNPEQKQSES
jgi:phosphatidylinositol glycan class A protein